MPQVNDNVELDFRLPLGQRFTLIGIIVAVSGEDVELAGPNLPSGFKCRAGALRNVGANRWRLRLNFRHHDASED